MATKILLTVILALILLIFGVAGGWAIGSAGVGEELAQDIGLAEESEDGYGEGYDAGYYAGWEEGRYYLSVQIEEEARQQGFWDVLEYLLPLLR